MLLWVGGVGRSSPLDRKARAHASNQEPDNRDPSSIGVPVYLAFPSFLVVFLALHVPKGFIYQVVCDFQLNVFSDHNLIIIFTRKENRKKYANGDVRNIGLCPTSLNLTT